MHWILIYILAGDMDQFAQIDFDSKDNCVLAGEELGKITKELSTKESNSDETYIYRYTCVQK